MYRVKHTYMSHTLAHAHIHVQYTIGLYRENAIAIESDANDSFGGNVYYVSMQITLPIP